MAILSAPNYAPRVRRLLTELIEKNKAGQRDLSAFAEGGASTGSRRQGQPYIVTDWDNTAIIFDSQQSLFIYQLEGLHYRLLPERFGEIIDMELTEEQKAATAELRRECKELYRQIYTDYQGLGGKEALEQVKKGQAYSEFAQLMPCLYKYPFGHLAECCRIIALFEGYRLEEIAELTEASIQANLQMKPQKRVYRYRAGGQEFAAVFYLGMRFVPEQEEFYRKCMENGIEVYVCSASHEQVVRVHAARYGIPPENVFALSLKTREGVLKAEMNREYPFTVKEGKADAIRQRLLPLHGSEPLLIMGDSMGDFAMLTAFSGPKFLVRTKLLPQVLSALKEAGVEEGEIFIQGRREDTAEFTPNEEWTLL